MGAIDNRVNPIPVYLDIVPHISKLFHHGRVHLSVDIPMVPIGRKIEIVERRLVTTHITLVEQIHPFPFPRSVAPIVTQLQILDLRKLGSLRKDYQFVLTTPLSKR